MNTLDVILMLSSLFSILVNSQSELLDFLQFFGLYCWRSDMNSNLRKWNFLFSARTLVFRLSSRLGLLSSQRFILRLVLWIDTFHLCDPVVVDLDVLNHIVLSECLLVI